jgi:hypothetical protein
VAFTGASNLEFGYVRKHTKGAWVDFIVFKVGEMAEAVDV